MTCGTELFNSVFVSAVCVRLRAMMCGGEWLVGATVLLLQTVSTHSTTAKRDVGYYEGDLLLAAFFPIHERADMLLDPNHVVCGALKQEDSIQLLEAFFYALDHVNADPDLLPGITLGALVLDSCSDEGHALGQGVHLLRFLMMQGDHQVPYQCADGSVPHLQPQYQLFHKTIGVLGGAISDVTMHLASLLRLFSVPQVGLP